MPVKENLLQQKFERLTVIAPAPSKNKKTYWLCQCDCGNTIPVRADALKGGKTKSCGCLNNEKRQQLGKNNIQDLTNQRFGKLIAKERLNIRRNSSLGYDWLCQCDCGNIINVSINDLKSGNTLSCGCAKESHGEKEIAILLINNNIKFETQKTFENLRSLKNYPLRFDFYLIDLKILIEFDGPQHYSQTNFTKEENLKNDILKNQWCLNNDILLYRIPYQELKNISKWNIKDLLNEKFIVKEEDHYHINQNK